jgi:hypothetical protein
MREKEEGNKEEGWGHTGAKWSFCMVFNSSWMGKLAETREKRKKERNLNSGPKKEQTSFQGQERNLQLFFAKEGILSQNKLGRYPQFTIVSEFTIDRWFYGKIQAIDLSFMGIIFVSIFINSVADSKLQQQHTTPTESSPRLAHPSEKACPQGLIFQRLFLN